MILNRVKIDRSKVEWENGSKLAYIRQKKEWLSNIENDPDKVNRLEKCLCKFCNYTSSIGGAACCSRPCAFCDTPVHSGNTDVGVMCLECARKSGLCRMCGADLNYKNRRKIDFPDEQKTS